MDNSTREAARRFKLLALFTTEVRNMQFTEMHRLYDAAHITNKRLLDQRHKHCAPMTDFYNAIYIDIAYILIDEIINNPEIEALFQSLYDKKYPRAKRYVETAKSRILHDVESGKIAIADGIRYYLPSTDFQAMKANLNNPEFSMFVYNIYSCDELWEHEIPSSEGIQQDAKDWYERQNFSNTSLENNNRFFSFTDNDEPVFTSKMFERFIERRRTELADYLGVPEKQLNKTIIKNMSFDVRKEDLTYRVQPGPGGFSNNATIHMIQGNNGAATWLQTVTSPRSIRRGSLGYTPDVNQLIRSYFQGRVETVFMEKRDKGQEFIRSTLSRDCKGTPAEDYLAICFLYNNDVVYKMYQAMQEQYYADFSWEQITHKNVLTRNNIVIEDLRKVILDKDKTISTLTRENAQLREISTKQGTIEQVAQFKEEQRLNKIIENKDDKIATLRERLRLQEEMINLLQQTPEDEPTHEINIEDLHGKRFLFVGRTEETFPQLRQNFPDSIFMTNESAPISNIQVDAVVYLTRFMSHAMVYRIQSYGRLMECPIIYCNGTSINSIYQTMVEHIDEVMS